jgi:endonuclease-8
VAPRSVGRAPVPPVIIDTVEAVGKHLLIGFGDGLVLETHLRMTGSWHLYRIGEVWQRPVWQRRVSVAVDDWIAVCFNAPVVRTWPRRGSVLSAAAPSIERLGPDLCVIDTSQSEVFAGAVEVVLERVAQLIDPDTEIADVLLDQRGASGIGNVYKSEVLWACQVDPFAVVRGLAPPTLRDLYRQATMLLQANLGDGARRTMPGGGLAVYGRRGRRCPRCGTAVRSRPQGKHRRTTYWCPTCQPSTSTSSLPVA